MTKRQGGGKVTVTVKNPIKRRSRGAAAPLASPSYRKRVVKSVKTYRRKPKKPAREGYEEQNG